MPQVAFIDKVVDVPVEKQVLVPHVQKVQKAIEVTLTPSHHVKLPLTLGELP